MRNPRFTIIRYGEKKKPFLAFSCELSVASIKYGNTRRVYGAPRGRNASGNFRPRGVRQTRKIVPLVNLPAHDEGALREAESFRLAELPSWGT